MKLFLIFLMCLLYIGCGNSSKKKNSGMVRDSKSMVEQRYASLDANISTSRTSLQKSNVNLSNTQIPKNGSSLPKKLTKTGYVEFESKNVTGDEHFILDLVEQYDAYIEKNNQTNTRNRITYYMVIRVPADKYENLYKDVVNKMERIKKKGSNIEDITETYYDIETRLNNQKILEKRYHALLDKANEIKDILAIENHLNRVRIEIERLEKQVNYWDSHVNYSTLNIEFYEVLPYKYDISQREGYDAKLLQALVQGWQNILNIVIFIVNLWPLIVLIVLFSLYIYRKRAIKKKNRVMNEG